MINRRLIVGYPWIKKCNRPAARLSKSLSERLPTHEPEVDDGVLASARQVRVDDHVAVASKQLVAEALVHRLDVVHVARPLDAVHLKRPTRLIDSAHRPRPTRLIDSARKPRPKWRLMKCVRTNKIWCTSSVTTCWQCLNWLFALRLGVYKCCN